MRRWVKRSEKRVQPWTSAKSSVMRSLGSMAERRRTSPSAASFSFLRTETDRQTFPGERRLRQLAGSGENVDRPEARFQTFSLLVTPVFGTIGDGKSQLAGVMALLERVAGQQKIVEGAESAAALDPNVARLQPLTQRHHDRDLIGSAIDPSGGFDELSPCRPQEGH